MGKMPMPRRRNSHPIWKPQDNLDNDGKPKNGLVTEFFKGGTPSSEGKYAKGIKTGEWKTYDAEGNQAKTATFK